MKKHIIAALLLSASSAFATVTLQFSTGTIFATNWANSAGAGGTTLLWGVIIDTAGDGFDGNYKPDGVNFASTAVIQALVSPDGSPSDDVLFLSPNLMSLTSNTNDSAVVGQNRVTSIANIPFGSNNIGLNDPFVIAWFDHITATGTAQGGEKFGTMSDPAFLVPADGNTQAVTAPFVGADPLKPMTHTFVPEPSSLLLGLLGAFGLIRRRR